MASKKAAPAPADLIPKPEFEMAFPYLAVEMVDGRTFHIDASEHKSLEIGPPVFRVRAAEVRRISLVEG